MLEDPAQVSAVEGFVEEVLEHHAAVQAIVLKLVGHPGMRVANAAERIELQVTHNFFRKLTTA